MTLISSFLFDRFRRDRRGGVAPLLGLTIVPLIGFMAAAVDYSRANAMRTSLQGRRMRRR